MNKITNDLGGIDISGKTTTEIQELVNESPVKYWIRMAPADKAPNVHEYDEYIHSFNDDNFFNEVGNIVFDTEIATKGNKKGKEKRQTVIMLQYNTPEEAKQYAQTNEYIYIFTIDDKIVKIGGTRTSIAERWGSYLCGHHIKERGKSRDCSKTNGYIYNTFEFYLKQGCEIKMYAMCLPKYYLQKTILAEEKKEVVQTYHIYESLYIKNFKDKYGYLPIFCDNSDPIVRN